MLSSKSSFCESSWSSDNPPIVPSGHFPEVVLGNPYELKLGLDYPETSAETSQAYMIMRKKNNKDRIISICNSSHSYWSFFSVGKFHWCSIWWFKEASLWSLLIFSLNTGTKWKLFFPSKRICFPKVINFGLSLNEMQLRSQTGSFSAIILCLGDVRLASFVLTVCDDFRCSQFRIHNQERSAICLSYVLLRDFSTNSIWGILQQFHVRNPTGFF